MQARMDVGFKLAVSLRIKTYDAQSDILRPNYTTVVVGKAFEVGQCKGTTLIYAEHGYIGF